MLSIPTGIFCTLALLHIMRNCSQKTDVRVAPDLWDPVVQNVMMACITELLYQNHLSLISWILVAPAMLVFVCVLFYSLLHQLRPSHSHTNITV